MNTPEPNSTPSPQSHPRHQSLSGSSESVAAHSPRGLGKPRAVSELKLYSHSSLVYWWPVWVVGYLMAILTYSFGQKYQIGQDGEWFHASSNLGVFFFLTLVLVVVITNVSVRGLVSAIVIMGIALVSVLLAYFGWWDTIFAWFGNLKIHLNFGAYVWFSTLMLLLWAVSVFIVDRMSYWHIKPGQVTRVFVFGAGSKTYDTIGMVLEKHREDFFRHWLLGLGSGDLEMHTTGATSERITVLNVLFIGSKVEVIQRLISEDPHAA